MPTRRDFLRLASLALPSQAAPRPRARRVIFIELSGGMSHVDTFDFKENPGTPRGFDVREVSPGFYLSHRLFPRLSAQMHRFAVVRSIATSAGSHFAAQYSLQTGRPFHPRTGHNQATIGSRLAQVSFHLNRSLPGPLAPGGVNLTPTPSGMSRIDRDRYGNTELGAACAAARDLLANDAPARYIHICHPGWDHHAGIWDGPSNHYTQCAHLDAALSSLVEDLEHVVAQPAHSLLDETLLVAMSEFSRTPGALNGMGGRDHHTGCFPALFAGAGIEGGRVIGRTDSEGLRCVELGWRRQRQPRVEDVVATMASALGIDWLTGEEISEVF